MKNTQITPVNAIATPVVVAPVKRAFNKKMGGFSLNEILVSVAIMGSVAAVAAPYFADMSTAGNQATIEGAASQTMALINNTKGETEVYSATSTPTIEALAAKAGVDTGKVNVVAAATTITFSMVGATDVVINQTLEDAAGAVVDVYATF